VKLQRPSQRGLVLCLLALLGFPWQVALSVIESSWTVCRPESSQRLDKGTELSGLTRQPQRRDRLESAALVADDADDETEESAIVQAIIVFSQDVIAFRGSVPVCLFRLDLPSSVPPAPRIALRC
jgi:hypothetical protein